MSENSKGGSSGLKLNPSKSISYFKFIAIERNWLCSWLSSTQNRWYMECITQMENSFNTFFPLHRILILTIDWKFLLEPCICSTIIVRAADRFLFSHFKRYEEICGCNKAWKKSHWWRMSNKRELRITWPMYTKSPQLLTLMWVNYDV